MSLILIFADNGDFLVGNRQNLLGMIKDATVVGGGERTGVEKREYVCWGQDGEARDLTLTCLGKRHDIEYVLELRAIVWVITSGSDAMSKFRVSAADRAFPVPATVLQKNRGIPREGNSTTYIGRRRKPLCCTRVRAGAGRWSWWTRCWAVSRIMTTRRWVGNGGILTRISSCKPVLARQNTLWATRGGTAIEELQLGRIWTPTNKSWSSNPQSKMTHTQFHLAAR